MILSLEKKAARFFYSYIFIQHLINELKSKGCKQTDQSDGLNAVSHKKGHQKDPNGTGISHRRRDIPRVFWFLVSIAKVPLTT